MALGLRFRDTHSAAIVWIAVWKELVCRESAPGQKNAKSLKENTASSLPAGKWIVIITLKATRRRHHQLTAVRMGERKNDGKRTDGRTIIRRALFKEPSIYFYCCQTRLNVSTKEIWFFFSFFCVGLGRCSTWGFTITIPTNL